MNPICSLSVIMLWTVAGLAGTAAFAQEPAAGAAAKAAAEADYRANLEQHKNNPDILVLPGVVADRRTKQVRVSARATGLAATEPAEFILIGEGSPKDYEAIAVATAQPSSIHKALEFIGMKPGRPAFSDERGIPTWPKGERVIGHALGLPGQDKPVRLEHLILNTQTGTPLAAAGLVFVGSRKVGSSVEPGRQEYAADVQSPKSIASTYNEPSTVLDVPRHSSQTEVYSTFLPNPGVTLPAGTEFTVLLEPEHKDGVKRVVELVLTVAPQEGAKVQPLNELLYVLGTVDGGDYLKPDGLEAVLAAFSDLVEHGKDPFVQVVMARDLSLAAVRDLAKLLDTIDNENGIRIEPPPPGHLYYGAFLPNEEWRDREKRLAQPVELHLEVEEAAVRGTLKIIDQKWAEEAIKPQLLITDIAVPGAVNLTEALSVKTLQRRPLLVYAPATMAYNELLLFIRPVLESNPTVFVFLQAQ